MRRRAFLLAACTALSIAGFAQQPATDAVRVPRLLNFSGALKDSAGKPLTGVQALTFSVYSDPDSRTPLWQEKQNVQADEQGHYTVQLGVATASGVPLDLFSSGQSLWLGVAQQSAGSSEQARVMLVSVPYALKTGDADMLGGRPASAYMLAGSSAGSLTAGTSTESNMAAPRVSTQAACSSVSADGNASAGAVAVYSGNCALTENSTFVEVSGQVGIGTNAPAAPLDIRNTTTATSGTLHSQQVIASYKPAATSSANNVAEYVSAGGAGANNMANVIAEEFLAFHQGTGQVTLAEGMQGKVYNEAGGTLGQAEGIYAQVRNTSTGTINSGYGIYVDAPTNSGGGTFTNYYGLYVAKPLAATNNYSVYSAGGTNYFAGNVGIGTSSPAAKLEVNGATKFDSAVTFAAGQTFPGALTGATANGGLAVTGSTIGLLTSCSSGQVLAWSGSAWACSSSGGGGGGSITSVNAGAGLTGGGSSGAVTLAVDTSVVPELATANAFTASTAGATAMSVTATDTTAANTGVYGLANGPGGTGVQGEADNGATAVGVLGVSSSGLAGEFSGNVDVTGSLSKGGGSFKIDDPLDPANKYLYHSFVESPDMMNVYNGNVTTDAGGLATVALPGYFQALNSDYRYQLTVIGQFAQAIVKKEIQNNSFVIQTDKPNVKVSWQVTGIRQDPWANAHRIPNEVVKPAAEQGYYLYPDLYSQPATRQVEWARHPEIMKRIQARQQAAAGAAH